ncbi:hypothetical protein MRX96_031650 [Rhipicephalus microplus]
MQSRRVRDGPDFGPLRETVRGNDEGLVAARRTLVKPPWCGVVPRPSVTLQKSTALERYGSDSSRTTATSTSTAALETRRSRAADSGRRSRYSDTALPDRRKRASSTDTGTMPDPQSSKSKLWLYSMVAIVLTIALASAISGSLRAADAEADESHEYAHPKKATAVRPTQCPCSKNGGSNAADHDDGASLEHRRLTAFEPKQSTVAVGVDTMTTVSANKSATVDGWDKVTAAGGGSGSTVERLGGKEGISLDHGVLQNHAGKATKTFVGFKIGPGRRKESARASSTSRTTARNDAVAGVAREVLTQKQPDPSTSPSSTTLNGTTDDKTITPGPPFLPSKGVANAKRAVFWLPLKQLAKEYPEQGTPSAAAEGNVVGTSGNADFMTDTASVSEARSP